MGSRPERLVDSWLGVMITCAMCGKTIIGAAVRTMTGEMFCASHGSMPLCTFCNAPIREQADQLCGTCAKTAIMDQAAVKRVLPGIREELRKMGLELPTPVKITLISRRQMATVTGKPPGLTEGLTYFVGQTVVNISVISGLPEIEFGSVVAHECMHAWMIQQGYPPLSEPIAEGLCQLASYGYLRSRKDSSARVLRKMIEIWPDPVYGDGFRLVRDAVTKHRLGKVLSTVRRTGRLP